MLRGTNRSIIEISETEHQYFEKVLIFVKPEFGFLPISSLEKEAGKYINNMKPTPVGLNRYPTARARARKKRYKKIALGICFLVATATAILIFKLFL